MFAVLLAVATAMPSPSPAPLKTIVTVRTSPFCGAFATHVNSAITSAVDNDKSLGGAMVTLRSRDLSGTSIERRNELQQLTNYADGIYRSYRSGENEVNRLRELAKTAKDKDEQEEIKASADALGGVLYRQHLVQRDLDGFVAYLQAGDMRRDSDAEQQQNYAIFGASDAAYAATHINVANGQYFWRPPDIGRQSEQNLIAIAGSESPAEDVQMAKRAAEDFGSRIPAILEDELTAGTRIAQANDRC